MARWGIQKLQNIKMIFKYFLFFLIPIFCTLIACNQSTKAPKITSVENAQSQGSNQEGNSSESKQLTDTAGQTPMPLMYTLQVDAKNILKHLIHDEFDSMVSYIHPAKGMRISPMVRIENYHPIFTRDSLKTKMAMRSIFWGYGDGSGLPINLSWKAYKKKYFTNRDYLSVGPIMTNIPVHFTLTKQNVQEFYPGSYIEDFTVNPNEDHDWGSVILVFEKWQNKWFLSGILSNYWTI